MKRRSSRTVALIIFFAFIGLLLCGVMAAGGFWLGQRVARSQSSPVDGGQVTLPVEAEVAVQEAEATEPSLPAVPTAEPTIAADEASPETEAVEENPAEEVEIEPEEAAVQDGDAESAAEAAGAVIPGLERDNDFTEEDLDVLWEAWQIIETEFDGELPTDEELSHAAIRGMLETLGDDFTRYAPPAAAERMREDLQGSFEGIGAFVRENEEGLTEIARPMDGQPADQAGLEAGDVVIGVDGESVIGRSLDEVIALIRGPRGSEVVLTIRRADVADPFDVTIVRERIEIPVIETRMLEEGIGYIWLTSFNRNAEAQLEAALQQLLAEDPQGIIFDLRDNPGGYLDQSVAVADLFLPEGVVLYERSATYGLDETYRSDDGDLAEEIPLVVLVNAGSASASEIVAGAIRDNGRGLLVGETTFGKGSVQQSHTLSDGSELRVTVARWYIPSNQSIDETGIAPDIEVPTPEDLGGEEDPQLERAIEYILTGE